jgi:hypothetical protein
MRFRALIVPAAVAALAAGPAALGADDPSGEKSGSGLASLILLLPPLILLVLIGFVVIRSGSLKQGNYMAKAGASIDKSLENMARMEKKTDRMIELLESIDRKLGQGTYWESTGDRTQEG